MDDRLNRLRASVLEEDYQASFTASEAWIRNAAAHVRAKEARSNRFLQSWQIPRYRIAYFTVLIVLCVGIANIPVKQQETLGHVLTWSSAMSVSEVNEMKRQTSWMQPFQLAFLPESNNSITSFFLMMPHVFEDQALKYVQELQGNNQISSASIRPLQEQVMRPAYALLLHLFRINVRPSRRSTYEVINDLESQMDAMGMEDVGVFFERDEQGRPELHIWVATQFERDSSAFRLQILNDSSSQMNSLPFDPKSFEGKSREEIKELMRAALKERFFEKFNAASPNANTPDSSAQNK